MDKTFTNSGPEYSELSQDKTKTSINTHHRRDITTNNTYPSLGITLNNDTITIRHVTQLYRYSKLSRITQTKPIDTIPFSYPTKPSSNELFRYPNQLFYSLPFRNNSLLRTSSSRPHITSPRREGSDHHNAALLQYITKVNGTTALTNKTARYVSATILKHTNQILNTTSSHRRTTQIDNTLPSPESNKPDATKPIHDLTALIHNGAENYNTLLNLTIAGSNSNIRLLCHTQKCATDTTIDVKLRHQDATTHDLLITEKHSVPHYQNSSFQLRNLL